MFIGETDIDMINPDFTFNARIQGLINKILFLFVQGWFIWHFSNYGQLCFGTSN